MQIRFMSLFIAALFTFHAPAFAGLPQLNSALENYMDNPDSPRALNQVRQAARGLEAEGVETRLGKVLSMTDGQLKTRVDHFIKVAENLEANRSSLQRIGACLVVGTMVALAQVCYLNSAGQKSFNSGYALQPSVQSTFAATGQ